MKPNGRTVRKKQTVSGPKQTRADQRTNAKRHVLNRVAQIHRAIHSGKYPNAHSLAGELGKSADTIYDDIDYMRDTLGLPIDFDNSKNGYFYYESVDYCPTVLISEGELFSMILAEKALEQCVSPSQRRAVLKTFRKIAGTFHGTVSFELEDLDECISFGARSQPRFDPERITLLAKAAVRGRQLRMIYETPEKPPGERIVDPYHVRRINRDWILFCYDHKRERVIRLALARMSNIEETGKTFVRPKDFSVTEFLKGALGIYTGEEEHHVIIRFNKKVAHLIRENEFNGQTNLIELADSGVELHLQLSSLVEIHRMILEFAGDAIPVEPPELREMYICTARKMLGNMAVA